MHNQTDMLEDMQGELHRAGVRFQGNPETSNAVWRGKQAARETREEQERR